MRDFGRRCAPHLTRCIAHSNDAGERKRQIEAGRSHDLSDPDQSRVSE